MMKKQLLFFVVMLMPMLAFAQYIEEKEAREIAASVLKNKTAKVIGKVRSADAQGHYEITDPHLELHRVVKNVKGNKPCFYIYNQKGRAEGFAIVSNQGQLLAHSNRGTMDYDNAPDNVKWLLEQYRKILSIDYGQPYPGDSDADKIEGRLSLFRKSIEPLIGSEWHQNSPFNNLVKEKYEASGATYDDDIVAGCVTIAMAQTMFYWKHPKRGVGSKEWEVGKTKYQVNFEEPIDWEHIGPSPYWKPSTHEALADLSYRVAASLDSNVEDGETSAYAGEIPKALTTFFDYDASIRDEYDFFYSADVYEDIAYTELENGRPCIIYGQDSWYPLFSKGHTMVVEGYDAETNHFFINMGWGMVPDDYEPANAYYALTVKNSYHEFVVFQHLITHISPNHGGGAKPRVTARSFSSIQSGSQARSRRIIEYDKNTGNNLCHVSAQLYSQDMDADIITGIIAKDYMTGQECVFEGPALNLINGELKELAYDIDLSKIEYNGYYQLCPVFRMAEDEEWFAIGIQSENEYEKMDPICVDVSNAAVLDVGKEVNFTLSCTTLEPGLPVHIEYKLPIDGVHVTFTSSDPTIVSVDENGKVVAHNYGEATITAHCDDYMFNGNRLVKETTKTFPLSISAKTDHEVELLCLFPKYLESDEMIVLYNNIDVKPEYDKPGYGKEIEYTIGFFRDGELVKKGYSWRGQWMAYNRFCQYDSTEYLWWHNDLPNGEYELRLLYRFVGETPDNGFWVMPSRRDGEAKVFMTLENGHATFRQSNSHPCELHVDTVHTSQALEVGLNTTFTIDVTRSSDMEYDDYSDLYFYVDGVFEGFNSINFKTETSSSYEVSNFGYTYYFSPDHAGPYNIKVVDGRHHFIYDENIIVEEAKDYQLRVNKVVFLHSTVPNTANEGIQIELEIENIGEHRYKGDVICRPIADIENENLFWPPRFELDIAPGEIVRQILPMQFDFYFECDERIFIKCYYTSKGKDTVLWQSEWLTYIDPATNGLKDVEADQQPMNRNVYSLQGLVVCTYERFNQLPPGLYIVGDKVIQKKR